MDYRPEFQTESEEKGEREGGREGGREICQKIRLKSETEGERERETVFPRLPISGGSCNTRKSSLAHAAAQVCALPPSSSLS